MDEWKGERIYGWLNLKMAGLESSSALLVINELRELKTVKFVNRKL